MIGHREMIFFAIVQSCKMFHEEYAIHENRAVVSKNDLKELYQAWHTKIDEMLDYLKDQGVSGEMLDKFINECHEPIKQFTTSKLIGLGVNDDM